MRQMIRFRHAAFCALTAILIATGVSGSQILVTPRGETVNVRSSLAGGGVIQVTYDLVADDPRAEFSVTLEVSDDGGRTWNVRATSLTGDVGQRVMPGAEKRIVWQT